MSLLSLLLLGIVAVESIVSSPEDATLSPIPAPTSFPLPSPTPWNPLCQDGEEQIINGKKVCIPKNCLSDPRYSLFIECDDNGLCSCEDGCEVSPVYQITIQQFYGTAWWNLPWGQGHLATFRALADGNYPSCIEQIARECGNRWSTDVTSMGFIRGPLSYSDSSGIRYDSRFQYGRARWTSPLPGASRVINQTHLDIFFGYTPGRSDPIIYGSDECVVDAIGGQNDVASMTLLLDSTCKPISNPPYQCGLKGNVYHDPQYWLFASPVSLVLDSRDKIGDAVNVVQFPLDTKKTGKWYAWKASAKTPLVVFDPKHTGEITNATQLFGNHTFGKYWKNGFEALATLDLNRDGKIAGSELTDLGLWFDHNQDGVSQKGEVQDLRLAGITALYYKTEGSTKEGEDIHIAHGFDRIVNGQSISGAAIDWFVVEYQSRAEGMIKEQARVKQEFDSEEKKALTNEAHIDQDSAENVHSAEHNKFTGAWIWKTAESNIAGEVMQLGKGETAPMGMLTFRETDNLLTGHSFIEIKKPKNNAEIGSEVVMFSLQGKSSISKNDIPTIEFTVRGENGLETKSKAELSADGRWLIGQSTMQIGRQPDGTPILVDYLWKGERVK